MALADIGTGSKVLVAYVVESVFGTTPATPTLITFPVMDWSLNTNKDVFQDQSIRGNRQHYYDRHGNRHVSGDFGVEVNGTNFDPFFESLVCAPWASNVLKKGAVDTRKSFSIEVQHTDLGLYQLITGAIVNKLSLNIPVSGYVTGKWSMLGVDQTLSDTSVTVEPLTPETLNEPYSHNGGTFKEGGSAVGYFGDIKIDIDNKYVNNFALGSNTIRDFTAGFIDISGTAQVYFEDAVMYNKFLNATNSSIEFTLTNGTKTLTVLIPKVVYETANKSIKGQQAVVLEMNFRGVYDGTEATSIKFTRT